MRISPLDRSLSRHGKSSWLDRKSAVLRNRRTHQASNNQIHGLWRKNVKETKRGRRHRNALHALVSDVPTPKDKESGPELSKEKPLICNQFLWASKPRSLGGTFYGVG